MSSYRSRGYSPPRYYGDQPRSTTGNVYATSFDAGSRGGSSPLPRATVGSVSSGRHNVAYQAQPMRKSTYADGKTRTEYAIRPRNEPSAGADGRRPLSVSTRPISPTRRNMAVLASPREMTPTAVRDDSSRLLQPAPAHGHQQGFHQRHNSTSLADLDQRDIHNERREKPYHPRPPYVQRVYDERPPARSSDDEWSYTTPHEQFDIDFPPGSPGYRGGSRRERPARDYEVERPASKRDLAPPQTAGRPSETRDKPDGGRHGARSGYGSDPDRRAEPQPRKRPSTRQPVVHQQAGRDDGYSSAKDDYDSRGHTRHRNQRYDDEDNPRERLRDRYREEDPTRDYDRKYHKDRDRDRDYERDRERPREHERGHRESRDYPRDYHRDYNRDYDRDYDRDDRAQTSHRSKPRSRESSPERSGLKSLATSALGTLAAAGVVKGFTRDSKEKEKEREKEKDTETEDQEPQDRRRRRHRRRSRTEDQDINSEVDSERRKDDRKDRRPQEGSGSETPDGKPPRRRHSHRRRRDDEEAGTERLAITDGQEGRDDSRVRPRDEPELASDPDRSSRELVPVSRRDVDSDSLETRTMSPGENEDDRPRRVQLVEPVKDKEESRPKGILKPTRQVPFPEDPNPIREGVAPLKDASKDGIPPNARWTKISRVLVNPEALEKLHERFEERDDYVIVLRVLTRDEIKKFADKTKEIREIREKEWQEKLEERRRRKAANGGESSDSNSETDYGNDGTRSRPQLAIEQGPPAPPADFHNLQPAGNQQFPPRAVSGGPSVPVAGPETNVEANYSQNV